MWKLGNMKFISRVEHSEKIYEEKFYANEENLDTALH